MINAQINIHQHSIAHRRVIGPRDIHRIRTNLFRIPFMMMIEVFLFQDSNRNDLIIDDRMIGQRIERSILIETFVCIRQGNFRAIIITQMRTDRLISLTLKTSRYNVETMQKMSL